MYFLRSTRKCTDTIRCKKFVNIYAAFLLAKILYKCAICGLIKTSSGHVQLEHYRAAGKWQWSCSSKKMWIMKWKCLSRKLLARLTFQNERVPMTITTLLNQISFQEVMLPSPPPLRICLLPFRFFGSMDFRFCQEVLHQPFWSYSTVQLKMKKPRLGKVESEFS